MNLILKEKWNVQIKINNIYISTKEFTFSSNETQILSKVGDLSISNKFGEINNIPFTDIKFIKKMIPISIYIPLFWIDEKIIENEDL